MSTSELQANVAPAAASAKGKLEQSTAELNQQQPAQQQKPQQRAPKLAPAPVPQQTPWKATPIDHTSDSIEGQKKAPAVVAAAAAASSSKSNKEREQQGSSSSGAKRATTGKEKWVPFAPVPIPAQQTQSSTSSSSSSRSRSNKRQSGQGNNGNAMKNRRNPGNNDKRPRGAGHQRSQSRARNDDHSTSGNSSGNTNNSSASSSNNNSTVGNNSNSGNSSNSSSNGAASNHTSGTSAESAPVSDASADLEKLSLDEKHERRDRHSNNSAGMANNRFNNNTSRNPQPRKTPRVANRMSYYPGNFIPGPGAMPYGMPMPMVPVAPVMPAAAPTEYILSALVQQVDYYFSTENLCKDMFLRKNMNDEGFVPISVIAAFNRVKMLAPNTDLVARACAIAANIEVVGSKLRAVKNWQHWILPESERLPNGLDNSQESADAASPEQEPKFQVDQAVPFVPKSEK